MLIDIVNRSLLRQTSNGIWFGYDTGRSKWLSAFREKIYFSVNHKNVGNSRWMTFETIPSNLGGYSALRDATITSLKLYNSTTTIASVKIYKNFTEIYTVSLSTESSKTIDDINIDINENEGIQVEIVSGSLDYPIVSVELAWRETF